MKTNPEGFWQDGLHFDPLPRLQDDDWADVVIVGGGLLGMWAALDLRRTAPEKKIMILEEGRCGWGPSGRNGGIAYDYWTSLPLLQEKLGQEKAVQLADFSADLMSQLPEELGEIDYRQKGVLHLSTSPYHDRASDKVKGALLEAGRGDLFRSLDRAQVRERVRSPRFRGGVYYPNVATLNPGLLVQKLRDKVLEEGVEIYEKTSALHAREGLVRTSRGQVRSEQTLLATGALGYLAPRFITASSSTIVATEPIPDILEAIGWTGGEAITDERKTVRYMQVSQDKRIVFGWGRGPISGMRSLKDREGREQELVAKELVRFFPEAWDARLEYAWGGPIDISPTHLPFISENEDVWQAGGFTGNGLCGTRIVARILASKMTGAKDEAADLQLPALPWIPPEPLRTGAAAVVRSSLLRKEAAEERGERPTGWDQFVSGLPARLGIEIGR